MANTVFASAQDALDSLEKNGFAYTQWNTETGSSKGAKRPAKHTDYLKGFSRIAAFLCNEAEFKRCLGEVSSDMWDVYRNLDPKTRNKFTRAMSEVARTKHFHFRPGFTANTTPIGTKLIGGDPQLGYLLRNQLFWKDSMDLRHGEHSHSLQWLAIAQWNQAGGISAAELYALTADYRARKKDDPPGTRSMTLWQWLADCFPTDMKKYATEIFNNNETLESQSFRSPQLITDYLLPLGAPINDHFISHYLFHRYRKRQWLQSTTTTDWRDGATSTTITKRYTGDPKTHRLDTAATRGWQPSQRVDKRLVRDPATYGAPEHAGEPSEKISATFHGNGGDLSYFYGS